MRTCFSRGCGLHNARVCDVIPSIWSSDLLIWVWHLEPIGGLCCVRGSINACDDIFRCVEANVRASTKMVGSVVAWHAECAYWG